MDVDVEIARKLTKRLEDLIQDSTALKPQLIPQLQALNNTAPELVNFGIGVSLVAVLILGVCLTYWI